MHTIYFVPLIFFVIAFIFSMLGMGGSQIYIPVLFWCGLDFKTEAIPLGMLLNVVNSSSAAVTYTLKKMVDWRIALTFGITMLIFAPLGTLMNIHLPTRPIIAIFAIFTAVAGLMMLIGFRPKGGKLDAKGRTIVGLTGGAGLGFLAGLIGRGGGSFIVPLLYMCGLEAKTAAATSSVAVTFSGTSSFISHLATAARPNWLLWGACVLAVFAGSQLGSRFMSTKLKGKAVRKVFAIVLLAVAAILIIKDVL